MIPRSLYACGYCNCFAIAVHEITGWPLYMITFPPDKDNEWPSLHHVFAVTPDGFAFDAHGPQGHDYFMLKWMSSNWPDYLQFVHETSKSELVQMSRTSGGIASAANFCTRSIITDAKRVARVLLKDHGYL